MRRLHKAAYLDVITRQFGPWDDEVQALLFSRKWVPEEFDVLLIDGSPIGCIRVEDHPDHMHFAEIQILPEFQGRGIGSDIIRNEMARAKGLQKPVRLQVLTSNHRALELYLRLGFEITGATDRHLVLSTEHF